MPKGLDALGAMRQKLREIESQLQDGGPDVNRAAVRAYVSNLLAKPERMRVAELIGTWRPWYASYWQTREEMDAEELSSKRPKRPKKS